MWITAYQLHHHADQGSRAWDMLKMIISTATRLGGNMLHYLRDWFSDDYQTQAVADLVRQTTQVNAAAQSLVSAA
jgi:hypothetical protein